MCSVSLESYNSYLPPQKVSKNPKIYCIHSGLPKNARSRFGSLGHLGVNASIIIGAQATRRLQSQPPLLFLTILKRDWRSLTLEKIYLPLYIVLQGNH
jgi:hypothetical protein